MKQQSQTLGPRERREIRTPRAVDARTERALKLIARTNPELAEGMRQRGFRVK